MGAPIINNEQTECDVRSSAGLHARDLPFAYAAASRKGSAASSGKKRARIRFA